MAFRADEAEQSGYERLENYLILRPRDAEESQRARSREALEDIVQRWGPAVDSYPTWHPLVSNNNSEYPLTIPDTECGYKGLDHTRFLANGFITCPYGDGQAIIDSVAALPYNRIARISAEKLDVQFYHPDATPILVTCNWGRSLASDRTIPANLAIPLLLEQELPRWRDAHVAETWESMRDYFLGTPCGSRSSLFVNQRTGQIIKNVWNTLIYTGMYGPINV